MKVMVIITMLLIILGANFNIQGSNAGVLISNDSHGYYLEYAEIFE